MKKNKSLFFILILIFVLPLFSFACNETTFDSLTYVLTEETSQEVMEKVDFARNQTILNEIKMELKTETTYTIYSQAQKNLNKTISKKATEIVGKDRENNLFYANQEEYENEQLQKSQEKTYLKQVVNNSTNAYCYTLEKTYNDGKKTEVTDVNYLREIVDYSTTTTLTNLYTNIIKKFNANAFDKIYYKSFNGTDYYKLVSDAEGLGIIKEYFYAKSDLLENPELFYKAKPADYIPTFSCEFGLKQSSGTVYITYFKLDYSVCEYVNNSYEEKYLDVSSKTTLENYGDNVVIPELEDKGEYVANTFFSTLKEDNSYCVYNLQNNDGVISETTYTALKIKKQQIVEEENISFFDYSIKVSSTQDYNYYISGRVNNDKSITYKLYKVNKSQKTLEETSENIIFYLNDLDFSVNYEDKNTTNNYYVFGTNDKEIKVYTEPTGELSFIEGKINSSITKLKIKSYGINNEIVDLVSDFSEYTIVSNSSND